MPDRDRLVELAARQLAANRRRGVSVENGLRYDFVCPSASHYPFQWFWDSCFHAIALTHVDVRLAEQELRCLLQAARPDGFLPHIMFWERDAHQAALESYSLPLRSGWTTDTIQPPLLATAVRRVWEAGRSRKFLEDVLPATRRLYAWLAAYRDPDDDGLISILQPDESGLDASPKYDAPLGLEQPTEAAQRRAMERLFAAYAPVRGDTAAMFALDAFNVEDVLVNTIYTLGLHDLAALRSEAGDRAGAADVEAQAVRTEQALLAKCWDAEAGAFWDVSGREEAPLRVLTITSLLPLALPSLPSDVAAALVAHLRNPQEFAARYPVPSVAMREPTYCDSAECIWRGPTWINTNWYLAHGLRRHGYAAEAETIAQASRELVLAHGFREYYDPDTGAPAGAHGFGWSTLVIDMESQPG